LCRDFSRFRDGRRSCFFYTASSQPPHVRHCCCARRTAAHSCTEVPDSIEGNSGSIVSGQGVVATPSKLHGLTRGHEAMAGRRRPTTQYGTFYLDQVEDTVIPAPARGVSICALALSKGRIDQRSPGRTQPQACGKGCPGLFGKGARAPPKHRWPQPKARAPVSNAVGDPRSGPSPMASTKPRRALQLSTSWEGPFKVTGMHRPEGNHLATTEGVPHPDTGTSL
jgi:hypothetical protein